VKDGVRSVTIIVNDTVASFILKATVVTPINIVKVTVITPRSVIASAMTTPVLGSVVYYISAFANIALAVLTPTGSKIRTVATPPSVSINNSEVIINCKCFITSFTYPKTVTAYFSVLFSGKYIV
jgi:hypothetical protein